MGSTEIDNYPFEGMVEGQLGERRYSKAIVTILTSKTETGSVLQDLYVKDPHPDKVNLLRGAYQADVGTPFVPPSTILVNNTPQVSLRDSNRLGFFFSFIGSRETFSGFQLAP